MAVQVGINGFGRIGRITFRALAARSEEFEVVGINDLGDPAALANLLKYDSSQGRFPGTVEVDGNTMTVNGRPIRICAERDPGNLPWGELGVEVALESTGFFTKRAADGKPGYDGHLAAGARKVVISAPAGDTPDLTVVLGVNDDQLTAEHLCVSNASCTTNCLAPVAKVLHESFGIESGLMTTVHAYTNDQRMQDMPHPDLYRARAGAQNIIPTSTGAAKAVGLVIPELNGKLTGISMRVPVPTGSVVDLTVNLATDVTAEEINDAIRIAAEGPLKGILFFATDPLVSSDIIDDPHSSIFAADFTQVLGDRGRLAKVVSWYDNEWGYSCRTADLVAKFGAL